MFNKITVSVTFLSKIDDTKINFLVSYALAGKGTVLYSCITMYNGTPKYTAVWTYDMSTKT